MQAGVQIETNGVRLVPSSPISFQEKLGTAELRSLSVETLQVNVGKLCNQACKHCHVDASPTRKEIMPREVVDACLKAVREFEIPTFDITGGGTAKRGGIVLSG
jgi:sulfatase maturation enzyme AslB (radical SAM superfamily)